MVLLSGLVFKASRAAGASDLAGSAFGLVFLAEQSFYLEALMVCVVGHELCARGLVSRAPRTAGASVLARSALGLVFLAELPCGFQLCLVSMLLACVVCERARARASWHGRCE